MKKLTILNVVTNGFILLSAFSLLSVSLMAFNDPQAVMDLVNVKLTNADAFSSIRGVYGGVGLTVSLSILYLMRINSSLALAFLGLFWGSYAMSRTITIFAEGSLGAFGTQWLIIETVFCLIALTLYMLKRSPAKVLSANLAR